MSDLAILTGAGGFLASEVLRFESGLKILPLTHDQLDIANRDKVRECMTAHKPRFVINCAAFRDIDKAESARAEASRVNTEGPKNLAEACDRIGAKLIHFGTHGVFGGDKCAPYLESDRPQPLNHYALTKLEGEMAVLEMLPPERRLVIRISWPYGLGGNNFIRAILQAAKTRAEVQVVSDQTGTPNPVSLLAKQVMSLLREGEGLFHLSCKGSCSRFEFIKLLLSELNIPCRVVPVPAEAFPTVATRPRHIAIATEIPWMERIAPMPAWQEGFYEFLRENKGAFLE